MTSKQNHDHHYNKTFQMTMLTLMAATLSAVYSDSPSSKQPGVNAGPQLLSSNCKLRNQYLIP